MKSQKHKAAGTIGMIVLGLLLAGSIFPAAPHQMNHGDRLVSIGVSGQMEDTAPNFEEIEISSEEAEPSPGEAVVTSHEELAAALTDATTTTVYFGGDIAMKSGGIAINTAKPSLVIDGVNPYDPEQTGPYRLTEYNSSGGADTISVSSSSALRELTVRNLNITASNHYGIPYVTIKDFTVIYDHITYEGPQLSWNKEGNVVILDSTVYIGQFGRASSPGEVAEAVNLTLGGKVWLEQKAGNDNEIFWNEKREGKVIILSGADVEVRTFLNAGFIHTFSAAPTTLTVEENAVMRFYGPKMFWDGIAPRDITIKPGGELYINIENPSNHILGLQSGDLYVGEEAVLHVISGGSNRYASLYVLNGNAVFEDPASVLFYNPSYRNIVFGTAEKSLSITAHQVNYWTAAGDGSLDDIPFSRWQKQDGSLFDITAAPSAGLTGNLASITSNADDADTQPNANNFNLNNSRVLAFGRLDVTGSYGYNDQYQIQGLTGPEAQVRANYEQADSPVQLDGIADTSGDYGLPVPEPLEEGTPVTVRSAWNYLKAQAVFGADVPELIFLEPPPAIVFQTTKLSHTERQIPRITGWETVIRDTRGSGLEWKLTARCLQPFMPADSAYPPLAGTLEYRDGSGTKTLSQDEDILVYSHVNTANPEVIAISWEASEGLFASVRPGSTYAGVAYTAEILWTLTDAP